MLGGCLRDCNQLGTAHRRDARGRKGGHEYRLDVVDPARPRIIRRLRGRVDGRSPPCPFDTMTALRTATSGMAKVRGDKSANGRTGTVAIGLKVQRHAAGESCRSSSKILVATGLPLKPPNSVIMLVWSSYYKQVALNKWQHRQAPKCAACPCSFSNRFLSSRILAASVPSSGTAISLNHGWFKASLAVMRCAGS